MTMVDLIMIVMMMMMMFEIEDDDDNDDGGGDGIDDEGNFVDGITLNGDVSIITK